MSPSFVHRNKNFLKNTLAMIITIVLLGVFGDYAYHHWHELAVWIDIKPELIAVLVILSLLSPLISGAINQIITRQFGVSLRPAEWGALSFVVTSLNMILPFGSGSAARAAYLRKQHNFALHKFTSGFAFANVLSLLVSAILGSVITFFIVDTQQHKEILILAFFILVTLAITLLLVLPKPNLGESSNRLKKILININTGFYDLKSNQQTLAWICLLSFINLLSYAIRLYVAFLCTGQPVDFSYCLIASALALLSMVVTITPGAIGIREAVVVSLGLIFGISAQQNLVAVTLERVVSTFSIWLATPALLPFLKRAKHSPPEK